MTTKADVTQSVHDAITARLSPACVEHGLSLKAMPDDASAGTMRTAMLIVFVPGFRDESNTTSRSSVTEKQVSVLTIPAYVIVMAASQVGPRSATWAGRIAIDAIDGARVETADGAKLELFAKSFQFTSFKSSIWQYRVEVDCVVRLSSDNLSAKQDIERANLAQDW